MTHRTPERPPQGLSPLPALAFSLILVAPNAGWGQEVSDDQSHAVMITVSEIAELAIIGDPPSFTVSSAGAGAPPVITANHGSSTFLQYTSMMAQATDIRSITVSRSNTLPSGLTLRVQVTLPTGDNRQGATGFFAAGVSSGPVILDRLTGHQFSSPRELIQTIGSGWTGTAPGDGARLDYSLEFTSNLVENSLAGAFEVTVLYTLTAGEEQI